MRNFTWLLATLLWLTACTWHNEESYFDAPPECDTLNLDFQRDIQPIFQARCVACHSGSFAPKGYDYTSQAGVLKADSEGRLRGAINHLSGFRPMPEGGAKLTQCERDKIIAWLNALNP